MPGKARMSEKEAIARGLIPDPKKIYTTAASTTRPPDPIQQKGDSTWYRDVMAKLEGKANTIATAPVIPSHQGGERWQWHHYEWPSIPWLPIFIVWVAGFMMGMTVGFVMAP